MKSKYFKKDKARRTRIASPSAKKTTKAQRRPPAIPPEPAGFDEIEEAPEQIDPSFEPAPFSGSDPENQ